VVSHVGVIELSLVVMGQPLTVGSIHGVATHPDHRRRGYYAGLMNEVLDYCSRRYETLILTTEHPEYFEPFGFRVIQESEFRIRCGRQGASGRVRRLETRDERDIALLHRLLETREPVSEVVGVVREKAVFCFNEGWRPLHYVEDLDVVLCIELEGARLKLFDIAGPRIPTLASLLEKLPEPVDEVVICFAGDRVAPEAIPAAAVLDHDGPSYLMVNGPFGAEGRAFTLPRSART
jgi:hypothetical protein